MNPHRKSFVAKPADAIEQRGWWVIDASDIQLGRLATVIATKVRGKDKAIFTPHVDTGDFVVVVNAAKTKLTGRKLLQKKYYRHSGYPGGLRQVPYGDLMKSKPEFAVLKAVRGMLPKNSLGRQLLKKVKVYAGPEHPHTAQHPQPLELRS